MKRLVAVALAVVSCERTPAPQCAECGPGTGAVTIGFALTSSDVARVVATVSGAGIATPTSVDLTISGASASGTITGIPAGTARTVAVSAYPTDPEGAVVIYRGSTVVDITAGQVATASLTLLPVVGDVAVSASFPSGDTDVARIDHTSAVASGNRIESPAAFYLSLSGGAASGTVQKVSVGLTRTVSVSSFAADGTLLHQGASSLEVDETGSSVSVTMANMTGAGGASVSVGFCSASCANKVCGDDGCGGSCGGCAPDQSCNAGQCGASACTFSFNAACGETSCCQQPDGHEWVCCGATASLVYRLCTGPGTCVGGGTYPNCVGSASCPANSSQVTNTNGTFSCSNSCGAVGPGGCAICQPTYAMAACNASWNGTCNHTSFP